MSAKDSRPPSPRAVKRQPNKAVAAKKPTDWLKVAEQLLLVAYLALLVAAPITTCDVPANLGMFVGQSVLWAALAVGVSLWLWFRKRGMTWDVVDSLATAYLGWTIVATLAVWGIGDMRAAINSLFQTSAFVLALLLGRRLLNSVERRRNVLSVMLAVSTAMALLGIVQFLWIYPANRADIQAQPEILLEPLGIFDPQSPQAKRALARAFSLEPLGTFTLTNSLACFLVPSMILLLTVTTRRLRSIAIAGPLLLMLLACLLMTYSRMSILTLLIGAALLAASHFRLLDRGRWTWSVGGGALISGLVAIALWMGRESSIVQRAYSSVLFRLEYWQSTWAMIGDHWLFGCGPGNFKSVYPFYKLPQASEEIGDPHNFLLEVWATVGTPGVVLLVALLVVVIWRGWKKVDRDGESKGAQPLSPALSPELNLWKYGGEGEVFTSKSAWLIGGIAVAGLVVWIEGTHPLSLMIVIPATMAFYLAVRPLVTDDLWQSRALPLAAVTMLINLLAAGGIGFPNVALPLATLLCVSLPQQAGEANSRVSRPLLAVAATVVLYFACYFTCYLPVFRSAAAEPDVAWEVDPFSPELCRTLASLEMERLTGGDAAAVGRLEAAVDEAIRRDPRSFANYQTAGEARLAAYRTTKRSQLLPPAIENYASAANRYPNYSLMHANLAWAKHLAGDDVGSKASAQRSLRLNALCPHDDKLLKEQALGDPGLTVQERNTPLDQLMQQLVGSQ